MYRVIESLTQEHNHGTVAIAALVCIAGSSLSVLLLRRVLSSSSRSKPILVGLTGIMSGVSIWATHFIAMLAYEPGYPHGYAPVLTAASLLIAIMGCFAANFTLAYSVRKTRFISAGIAFGATISVMHYVGMLAYLIPGSLVWSSSYVVASLALGMGFGAIAYHRIAFPVTRYCWVGGTIAMVVAICCMHFVGMSAFVIELDPTIRVAEQAISDFTLGLYIISVTSLIFVLGFAALHLETRMKSESQFMLRSAAFRDQLSGLPNRTALLDAMDRWTAWLARDEAKNLAVITINLDAFKHVNELYGRSNGDLLLYEIARRLEDEAHPRDGLFRTGGDEYVILTSSIRREKHVTALAEHVLSYIREPIDIGDMPLLIDASIGVATSFQDGRDVDALLQKSGMAMFYAKANPDVKIQQFDANMEQESRAKLELQHDLRHAANNGELELAYQRQNTLPSRALIGFEVLLRWNHPKRGRVSPVEFIPIAEETGLIKEIGLWVLRTACTEAASWSEPLGIAVNVAPQQLVQPTFVENVSDILFETRLPPERLELEITEASIIGDQEHTLRVMHRLKVMGIRIAMDDFGTGYSSLATLQSFPFDKIKVDRSFVQDVHSNEQRAAIVRATVLIGDALGIPILAEGCETEKEVNFLTKERCASVQGFYFGKPMNVLDTRLVVAEYGKKRAG